MRTINIILRISFLKTINFFFKKLEPLRFTLLIIACVCASLNTSSGQCPTSINFSGQAGIDNYAINYPNCNKVTDLNIGSAGSDITNLDGISMIDTVLGNLELKILHGFGWDGTSRGQPVERGVYVYYAEILFDNGEIEIYKGDVTLLR